MISLNTLANGMVSLNTQTIDQIYWSMELPHKIENKIRTGQ